MKVWEDRFSAAEQQRYRIIEPLGSGAMGVVYRAEDCERGTEVALKVLKNLDPVAVFRFKQEFRALADVLHPNLVPLYELFAVEGAWYFTMELVHGVDFLTYVRAGSVSELSGDELARQARAAPAAAPPTMTVATRPTPVSWASDPAACGASMPPAPGTPPRAPPLETAEQLGRLRQAMCQLAIGVDALHRARRLHRDIKPSNVRVTPEGRVVLLDFGIVAYLGEEHTAEATAHLMGTPVYMAPEQATGARLNHASDWYAVGVMLYELLTGTRPFEGELTDILARKCSVDPTPPAALGARAPEDLERLCMELLARDPQQRPSGADILRRLGAAGAAEPVSPSTVLEETTLIGRGPELATLGRALEQVRGGQAATVYLHGRSGAGKTSLVQEFLRELKASSGALILTGRCYERESVPYKALDNLMDAITQHLVRLPERECLALLPPSIGDLARLFPVLRRIDSVLAGAVTLGGAPDPRDVRRRAVTALRDLLGRLTRQAPVIVWLDDLQWGDSDSALVLNGLLRQPDAPAILTIASYRSNDAGGSELLREFLAAERDGTEISVGSLPAAASVELAADLLQRAGAASPARAAEIAREADGDPLFLLELARHVVEAARADESVIFGNASLDEMLRKRLVRLDEGSERLLRVVAVAGKPISQGFARRAAGADVDVRKALAELRATNLVRTHGARDSDLIECYHDRIRECVVATLSPELLRQIHERLAVVLQQEASDAEQVAYHLECAGDPGSAARFYEIAAAAAYDAVAFDRAASLLRRAIELGPPARQEVTDKWSRLAGYLASGARGKESAAAYLIAAEGALVAQALDLRRLAAEQLLHCGQLSEGAALLEEVLREIGLRSPDTPRRQLASVLFHRARLRLRGLRFEPRDESQISQEDLQRIEVCWSATAGYTMIENLRGVAFQTRYLLYALKSGERSRIARGLGMEAALSSITGAGGVRRGERISDMGLEMARQLDDEVAVGWATGCRGTLDYQAGRWQQARLGFEGAQKMLREVGTDMPWERSVMDLQHLWALFQLGEVQEIVWRLPSLLRDAEDRGDLHWSTNLATGLPNTTWLLLDQPEQARQLAEDASRRWTPSGFHLQHYWITLALAHVELYEGEPEAALERVLACWSQMKTALLFRIRMVRFEMSGLRARCHLAVAARLSGPARATQLKQAERLARRMRREGLPPSFGVADLLLGGIAAARGRRERAREIFEAAGRELDDSDMPLYAALARHREGQLRADVDGTVAAAAAARSIRERGVVQPGRICELLAPMPLDEPAFASD